MDQPTTSLHLLYINSPFKLRRRFGFVPTSHFSLSIDKIHYNFLQHHLLSSPLYYLSLLVVTQIRGHKAGCSSPLPTTVRALHFFRDKISALSSLVDSRRIVLTHALNRCSQQLILFLFFSFLFFADKLKISPRRDSNSPTYTMIVAFEGYH